LQLGLKNDLLRQKHNKKGSNMYKELNLYLILTLFITSTSQANTDLFNVSTFIPEVSGATYDSYQNAIWSVGDSGKRALGRTGLSNKKTDICPIIGHKIATDREDLVEDNEGNIWILSVGDNDKVRDDIEINMVSPIEAINNDSLTVKRTIKIKYPDGPKNVEAAFYFDDKIFIIEKTLSIFAKIYTIDITKDSPSVQTVKYFSSIKSIKTRFITAACIDKSEDVFILTYYGTFKLENWKSSKEVSTKTINFSPFISQMETLVCYKDQLLLATEDGAFWLEGKK
jgi:hypothetical protein